MGNTQTRRNVFSSFNCHSAVDHWPCGFSLLDWKGRSRRRCCMENIVSHAIACVTKNQKVSFYITLVFQLSVQRWLSELGRSLARIKFGKRFLPLFAFVRHPSKTSRSNAPTWSNSIRLSPTNIIMLVCLLNLMLSVTGLVVCAGSESSPHSVVWLRSSENRPMLENILLVLRIVVRRTV